MDILSFTTIIVMLFLIIGAYLIFTNQVEGRSKIIIIVAVFICFIYILMNLDMFKSYTETKSSPVDASTIQTVTKVDTTSTSFSLSTWIYITDWNSGTNKTLFSMTNDIANNPTIVLGPYSNELVIKYYTVPSSAQQADWKASANLPVLFKAYTDARAAWITASNNERTSTGNYIVNEGTQTIGAVTPSQTPKAALRTITNAAFVTLKNARRAFDGGTTGQNGYSTTSTSSYGAVNAGATYNTNLSPSSQTSTTIETSTLYTLNPATVTDSVNGKDISRWNALSGGGKLEDTRTLSNNQGSWNITDNTPTNSLETIKIKDISIQKWVNIVVSFGDNTVDTYINGKLVNSHVSTGSVQSVSTTAKSSTLSWGGYTGYISSSRYYPRFVSPQEAWDIYKAGFSDNMLGNFLNQYNAKFTFSQNQVEKASFNII
jgi:hypothetical protein